MNSLIMTLLVFWLMITLIGRCLNLEKYGLEISPFAIMWKTKKFNNFIRKIAKKFPWLWKKIWLIGIPLGIASLFYGFYFLFTNLIKFFVNPSTAASVVPVLPGITITGKTLYYLFFALAVSVTAHELAHGLAAEAEEIPVRSSGVLLFILIPGAFVELDEERMKKQDVVKRLKIFSAGSMANLIVAVLFLILLINFELLILPLYAAPAGVLITDVVNGTPASKVFTPGVIIFEINLRLTTARHPANSSRGYIGIYTFNYYPSKNIFGKMLGTMAPYYLFEVVNWTFLLSLSLAIFNMLPIPFFDGDRVVSDLVRDWAKKRNIGEKLSKTIRVGFAVLSVLLLILNFVFTFLKIGFKIP
ncbi:MAG: hypothetical protein B6U95_05835 [Thermofilum sp. ex4484_82]|nr:MAG: hypothetical protein B6U95_05835 [Thermofilum sp. ex4484_82]OYT37816.1 MAG: hypothetical protein B6U96_05825 [Archaeoglobales archaeon ex4484_92]